MGPSSRLAIEQNSGPNPNTAITAALYVFGRDLRLDDHRGLAAAATLGTIVPGYIEDPGDRARALNPRRAAYREAALGSLAAELAARGARLCIRRGPRAAVLVRLARELEVRTVVWSAGYGARALARDRGLQAALEEAGLAVRIVHDAPAVSPEQIVAARAEDPGGYRSFAAFASAWEAQPRQPSTVALRFAAHDVVGEAPPQARGECNGVPSSEGTALAAFERYLERAALGYLAARRVPSAGATAHLAAPLSHGVLSARRVLERLEQRAGDRFLLAEERLSLRALRESLVRRDFFLQLAWCFEREPDAVLVAAMRDFRWARSHPALAAWREGRTGIPLVDAGMRELRASGWMHPRIRAVVASFLCFDMGLDWRIGRDAWEAELIEDEPALASGNWQWIAGIGADPVRLPRIYNPWKQARIHDPEGKYVRRWIPELAERPLGDRFDLRAAAVAQLRLQLFEDTYPAPLVDHDRAARAFLRRYGEHLRRPG